MHYSSLPPTTKSRLPETFGDMLLAGVVLHNSVQEGALDFPPFPAGPCADGWFGATGRQQVPMVLFLHPVVVASVHFITQQLLGNPLSSPPYKRPYQQSWVATSQQNSANPFLLWG